MSSVRRGYQTLAYKDIGGELLRFYVYHLVEEDVVPHTNHVRFLRELTFAATWQYGDVCCRVFETGETFRGVPLVDTVVGEDAESLTAQEMLDWLCPLSGGTTSCVTDTQNFWGVGEGDCLEAGTN